MLSKARLATVGLLLVTALAQAQIAATDKISDVRGTKHNFSAAADGSSTPSGGTVPTRSIKASSETQVCVFCHTPHEATTGIVAPLWNRTLSGATYTPYSSSSLEADATELAAAPGGSSKLCLSCHDGTMAIDKVNVLNGIKNATIAMNGATTPVKMPSVNAGTGFTRNLGTDLSNDHPISFTYDSTLAGRDGELRSPDGTLVGNRVPGQVPPKMPLENGQVQCATCHDPHLRDKTTSNGNAKFLRMNRFQVTQPTTGFSPASDIICLACHDKAGKSWAYSAHANSAVAKQTYKDTAAQLREFPLNTPVWQVGCLNCHDTHSVQGARRLLREGTDIKTGGSAALEETCYQCHTTSGNSAVTYVAGPNAIPDIKTDFGPLNLHMPIKSSEQLAGTEVHEIGGVFNDGLNPDCSKIAGKCGKDLLESPAKLGFGNLNNRHAECSDCHNPHRVVKFRDFRGNPLGNITGAPDAAGTHPHTDSAMNHTNIASGVLRGSWGVEPIYGSASFASLPTSYRVVRGDPGTSSSAAVTETFVTREYQICLKCHSNYGYADNNLPQPTALSTGVGNRPVLRAPGTVSGTNGATMYTNQAKEFQTPSGHVGPASNTCINAGTAAGAAAAYNNCNQRSWHPVMNATGRTLTTRGIRNGNPWRAPWNNQVGSSTMYCSDCHGSDTAAGTVIPTGGDDGNPWGPHGSTNNFILKGNWNSSTGNANATDLCFKCHDPGIYRSTSNQNGGGGVGKSGFSGDKSDNYHGLHGDKIGKVIKCNWCHVAVPHGWKNKAFLVNLNDLGAEVGKTPGTIAPSVPYTNGPYYNNAYLKITSFAASGQWTDSNCGGRDAMRNACSSPP
ncbi:MAG: cytochrome c3 family protein [Polaromonas sp.]